MPGKGTRRRAIRIPDEMWVAALAKAKLRGETLNEVIRSALEQYIAGKDDEHGSPVE